MEMLCFANKYWLLLSLTVKINNVNGYVLILTGCYQEGQLICQVKDKFISTVVIEHMLVPSELEV